MIKLLKGVSGYREDKSSFRYSVGSIVVDRYEVEKDLVKNGLAVFVDPVKSQRVEATAITPQIQRKETIKAVIKRGRSV